MDKPVVWARSLLRVSLLVLVAVITASCTEEVGAGCLDDRHCGDRSRSGYDPATPHCHPTLGRCYAGCKTDAQCRDSTLWWYRPGARHCDLLTRDCQATAVDASWLSDGIPDAGKPDSCAPPGVTCGGGRNVTCCSGHCVDGYCCESACSGDPGCGGSCTPKGTCVYPKAGTSCKTTCGGTWPKIQESRYECDAKHACVARSGYPKTCGSYACNPATKLCHTACGVDRNDPHKECVNLPGAVSLCLRIGAHEATAGGEGECLDPAKQPVIVVKPSTVAGAEPINKALSDNPSSTYFRIKSGIYKESIAVSSGSRFLVGEKGVILNPPAGKPGLVVGNGSTAVLQGFEITTTAAGSVQPAGVVCQGSGAVTRVGLFECYLDSNPGAGVVSDGCEVKLRRNAIWRNKGGGVDLRNGAIEAVNNLITDNGGPGSLVGGLYLAPASGKPPVLAHNTVANNRASSPSGQGAQCASAAMFNNAIFFQNGGSAASPPIKGCTAGHSLLEFGPAQNGNIAGDPGFNDAAKGNFGLRSGSPCINKGDKAASQSVIDNGGGPRLRGTNPDMGAFERQ